MFRIQTIEPYMVSNLEWIELGRHLLLVLDVLHIAPYGSSKPIRIQRMILFIPYEPIHPRLVFIQSGKDIALVLALPP